MRRVIGVASVALALTAGAAIAQQPAPSTPQHGPSQSPPGSRHEDHHPSHGAMCPMMGAGMMGGGMMPGMMGGGRMGMMGDQADPRMMQMRGEMMKAMGDIMMKYGKMMEGGSR